MGDNADRLGETLDANPSAVYDAGADLTGYKDDVELTLDSIRTIGAETGLNGVSADAAADRFLALSREVARISDAIVGVAQGGDRAAAAIEAAQQAYNALPSGELTFAERARFALGSTAMFPTPAGTVTGVVAGEILSQQRERERENKARAALAELDQAMADISFDAVDRRNSGVDDPTAGVSEPSTPAGSSGSRSVSTTWQPSAGARDSGGATVGSLPVTTPGSAGTSWQPTDPSGTGTIGGTVGGGSGTGSTGGQVSPGWPGTGSGGGPGIGGGHVPGTGDGSSSDGLVGGTVPGGSGSGGGSYGGGFAGSGGSGSGAGGLGLGAGGLAGGLTVGSAALGGAGLNRLAAGGVSGGAGGAGTGVAGGFGGAGAYGSVGGAGGVGGASLGSTGASSGAGSALSGSSSGSALGQGSQTGAAGAAASGQRAGGMMGGPMGGGAGGAGGANQSKRRGSSGLLAPDIEVEDGAPRPALGTGAGAGGRDSLAAPVVARAEQADDEW
jgi:hypothetical protein